MHLFDIDVKGGVRFKESDVLTGGSELTTFKLDNNFKIGVGICYDIRFEEMARLYRNDGKVEKKNSAVWSIFYLSTCFFFFLGFLFFLSILCYGTKVAICLFIQLPLIWLPVPCIGNFYNGLEQMIYNCMLPPYRLQEIRILNTLPGDIRWW